MKKIYILAFLLIAVPCFATDYYIDLGASYGNDSGTTMANAFNAIADVASWDGDEWRTSTKGLIGAEDRIFIRCGSSETITGAFVIDDAGSDGSEIEVAAYWDSDATGAGVQPTGSAVTSLDFPVFGENCYNDVAKPIITESANDNVVLNIAADYIKIHSLQIKEGTSNSYVDGDHVSISYCRFLNATQWAIKSGGSYSSTYLYAGYNYMYTSGHGTHDYDGIKLNSIYSKDFSSSLGNNATVEYNHIIGYGHAAVETYYTENATVQYNYISSPEDNMSECLLVSGGGHDVHHNWCEEAGIIQLVGTNNKIRNNVVNGVNAYKTDTGVINLQNISAVVTGNTIANNTIFYDGNEGNSLYGVYLQSGLSAWEPAKQYYSGQWRHYSNTPYECNTNHTSSAAFATDSAYWDEITTDHIKSNIIANNIIYNCNSNGLMVWDPHGLTASNTDSDANMWYNNSVYNATTNVAAIEGAGLTAAQLNARDDGEGNISTDPELENTASDQFWPEDSDANVVGAGYNLGVNYNMQLDPDATNFTATPPEVELEVQPTAWIIGAYYYPSSSPASCGDHIWQTEMNGNTGPMYSTGNSYGQSFVANKSISSASVNVTYYSVSTVIGGGFTLGDNYIRIDDDLDMSTYLCQSSAFEIGAATGARTEEVTGCTLTLGETYYIGIIQDAGDASNYNIIGHYTGSDQYANGTKLVGTGGWLFTPEDSSVITVAGTVNVLGTTNIIGGSTTDLYFGVELCDDTPP
jgi:hypothetical protein